MRRSHTVHKLIRRCLAAEWLASRENDCSRMHGKVSLLAAKLRQGHETGSGDI